MIFYYQSNKWFVVRKNYNDVETMVHHFLMTNIRFFV